MASYIQQILGPDEQVMAEGRVTRWIYARALAICVVVVALGAVAAFLLARGADAAAPRWPTALVVILVLAICVVALARPWIHQRTTNLVVTNRRVIAKFGLVARRTLEMRLSKIESIRVEQGFWARIGGFGTVIIDGTGGTLEPIVNVADPLGFKRAIETQLNAYEDGQRAGAPA